MPSLELCRYARTVNAAVRQTAPRSRSEEAGLVVSVLFASAGETLAALRTAAALAADLNARIHLVSVHAVPFPLPLDRPPVYVEFLRDQLRAVAEQCALPVEGHLYFGRDVAETLASVLPAESIVVVGSKSRWWPNRVGNLERKLRRNGHHIVHADGSATVIHRVRARGNSDQHSLVADLVHR